MAKIAVGIYDEHKLTGMGIQAILDDVQDIQVVFACSEKSVMESNLKKSPVNIFLINIHGLTPWVISLFQKIKWGNPRVKILVFSAINTEDIIINIIKAGANGFLSKETDKNELLEAIYTLRNGHDYFSNSITHLLLNRYINKIKDSTVSQRVDISGLSSRQIEILKLWGESYSNQEIADRLFISIRTVESHKNHIMQKLNLKTTVDMVKFAIRNNLIEV
jgi:DNA-binding NarL/FixJ family response regulator